MADINKTRVDNLDKGKYETQNVKISEIEKSTTEVEDYDFADEGTQRNWVFMSIRLNARKNGKSIICA